MGGFASENWTLSGKRMAGDGGSCVTTPAGLTPPWMLASHRLWSFISRQTREFQTGSHRSLIHLNFTSHFSAWHPKLEMLWQPTEALLHSESPSSSVVVVQWSISSPESSLVLVTVQQSSWILIYLLRKMGLNIHHPNCQWTCPFLSRPSLIRRETFLFKNWAYSRYSSCGWICGRIGLHARPRKTHTHAR